MARQTSLSVNQLAIACTAAMVTGAVVLSVLWTLGRPSHLHEREAQLQNQLIEIGSALREPGDADAYPSQALCRGSPSEAADALAKRVQLGAQGANLTVAALKVGAAALKRGGETLEPVEIAFEVNGRFDAAMGFLGGLAKSRPELFVDTLDLKSQTSAVSLKLTGRVLCSTPAS